MLTSKMQAHRTQLDDQLVRIQKRIDAYIVQNDRHPPADPGILRARAKELAHMMALAADLRDEISALDKQISARVDLINHNSGKVYEDDGS